MFSVKLYYEIKTKTYTLVGIHIKCCNCYREVYSNLNPYDEIYQINFKRICISNCWPFLVHLIGKPNQIWMWFFSQNVFQMARNMTLIFFQDCVVSYSTTCTQQQDKIYTNSNLHLAHMTSNNKIVLVQAVVDLVEICLKQQKTERLKLLGEKSTSSTRGCKP